jgi:hypothetical protein
MREFHSLIGDGKLMPASGEFLFRKGGKDDEPGRHFQSGGHQWGRGYESARQLPQSHYGKIFYEYVPKTAKVLIKGGRKTSTLGRNVEELLATVDLAAIPD